MTVLYPAARPMFVGTVSAAITADPAGGDVHVFAHGGTFSS